MNILFVSGELIAGDLALRLLQEGNDVRLFIEHPAQQGCLDGLVPKIADWKAELDWVGKDGLIVFDDVGYGEAQDELRRNGYRVVGGSAGGDRLELDRDFAQKVFADCGMEIEPTFTFADAEEALAFVAEQGGAWVIKQNNHHSHLSYVGVLEDGSDVRGVLASYKRAGIANLTVQRRLGGIEIGVARYYNGTNWVGPIEINQEHKGLLNADLGPKTGEMGTLMWYSDSSVLFDMTLGRLKGFLHSVDFRGNVALNCFVDGATVFPIEATARFGWPATHLHTTLHRTSWTELLSAVADGLPCDMKINGGYAIALTLAVHPFPYEGNDVHGVCHEGLPIFFTQALKDCERNRIHLEGVASVDNGLHGEQLVLTRSLGSVAFVTGLGETVVQAQQSTYELARKIVIPKVMYRTDIGDRFVNGEESVLRESGWI